MVFNFLFPILLNAFEPVVNNAAPPPCFFFSLKSLMRYRDVMVPCDFVSA